MLYIPVQKMTKMHPYKDRFLMSQMMLLGKNLPNRAFVNCTCRHGIFFLYLYLCILRAINIDVNFTVSGRYSPNLVAVFLVVVAPDEVFLVSRRWLYPVAVPVIRLYNAFLKARWIILSNSRRSDDIYKYAFCSSNHVRIARDITHIYYFNIDTNPCKRNSQCH